MDGIKITTDGAALDILSGHDLTEAERAELDYRDWSEDGNGWTTEYVRYRDSVYDLNDTEGKPSFAPEWDSYISDTFFSGILFRYPKDDNESVIVGTYYVS